MKLGYEPLLHCWRFGIGECIVHGELLNPQAKLIEVDTISGQMFLAFEQAGVARIC